MGLLRHRLDAAPPGGPSRDVALLRSKLGPVLLWAVSVTAALVTWSWSDVLLWQRIFESRGLGLYDAPYQAGHEAVLFGLIALGGILLLQSGIRWSLAYVAAVYSLAYGGAADVLYYWLDHRPIPGSLPWLDVAHPLMLFHPVTSSSLLASTAAWSAVWGGFLVATVVATMAGLARARRRSAAGGPAATGAFTRASASD